MMDDEEKSFFKHTRSLNVCKTNEIVEANRTGYGFANRWPCTHRHVSALTAWLGGMFGPEKKKKTEKTD
jgi:hypothetical protein